MTYNVFGGTLNLVLSISLQPTQQRSQLMAFCTSIFHRYITAVMKSADFEHRDNRICFATALSCFAWTHYQLGSHYIGFVLGLQELTNLFAIYSSKRMIQRQIKIFLKHNGSVLIIFMYPPLKMIGWRGIVFSGGPSVLPRQSGVRPFKPILCDAVSL